MTRSYRNFDRFKEGKLGKLGCINSEFERIIVVVAVLFSHSVMSDSLRPHGLQHARLPCPSPTPRACHTHAHGVCDVIQPSHPLSSPSPPAPNPSQHQGLFRVSSSKRVFKVMELLLSFSISPSDEYSGFIYF